MSDWKIGDRVQRIKEKQIDVGAVTAVDSQTVERTKYDYYTRKEVPYTEVEIKSIDVKWDDGTEEKGLNRWAVIPEDSKIERAFRLAVHDALERIDAKLSIASKAIQEAVKISEETGVPFSAGVSPLGQSYIPASLGEKFPELDKSTAQEIADAYGEYDGWQHSDVC
jgi:hypothetical protein